jgi:hypothetical protein
LVERDVRRIRGSRPDVSKEQHERRCKRRDGKSKLLMHALSCAPSARATSRAAAGEERERVPSRVRLVFA